MRTPTYAKGSARRLLACLAIGCISVTSCGLDRPVEQLATSDEVTTTTAPPPEVSPEAWEFIDAWYRAEVSGFLDAWWAAEVTTYFDALRAAPPWPQPPPPRAPAVQQKPTQGVSSAPSGFLACVRQRESGGDYGAVNRSSGAGGAWQFLPSTWVASGAAARTGVPRAEMATPAQQDAEAARLYASQGRAPWAGPGC